MNTIQEKLINATTGNTAFVFDFDGTMIHKFVGNESVPSIISILRSEGILGEEYSKEAFKLSGHYGTFERDPSIEEEEKTALMTEWWEKHLALLLETGLTLSDIKSAANHPKVILRTGVTRLLILAKNNNIPVFIFSASGIGTDAIASYLKSKDLMSPNIHVISNSFIFDDTGRAIGRNLPLIHSMNKSEEVLMSFPEQRDLLYLKSHILLLGDSLEDPHMVSASHHKNILRAGFLNEKDEDKISVLTPKYSEVYDLVVDGDSEFTSEAEEIIKILS